MKTKIYTKEEKEMLLKNPFVIDIKYDRFIEYDPIFKLWCVLKRITDSSETSRHLFLVAGFPIDLMNHRLPQRRIKEWHDVFYRYGPNYFLSNEAGAYLRDNALKGRWNQYPELNKMYIDVRDMLKEIYESSKENWF